MLTLPFGLDLIGLLILGGGAILLALALLVGNSSSSRYFVLGLVALLVTGLATWLPFLDGFAVARWPLLVLAGACAICLLLSAAFGRRLLATILGGLSHSRAQGSILLAAGLFLIVIVPWMFEREAAGLANVQARFPDDPVTARMHQKKVTVWTDRGNPLDVFDLGGPVAVNDERQAETQLVETRDLSMRLIRTAPADGRSNCHGWVFTSGRYLVDGGDVDRILLENDYQVVSEPKVGDLVIYRRGCGVTAHSAVVRVVGDDGLILLESKWNTLGRYLHRPEDYFSDAAWTYYRSKRPGHLLHGLEPIESSPGAIQDSEKHAKL